MIRGVAARQRRKARQLRERDVDPERAGAAAPRAHAAKKVRIERAVRDHCGIEAPGIDIGGDGGAAHDAPVREHDAGGPALLDQDLAHRRTGLDLHAMARRRPRHGLRDRAHAADGVPPEAFLAVHLAEGMVQEDVGGAGRVRTGVVADDGVEAEPGLHQLAFEPAIEVIRSRFREQVEQRAQIFRGQPAQPVAEASGFE